jgi:hypothetical protein
MTISSVGGTAQSYLSQLCAAQQVQSASPEDIQPQSGAASAATDSGASNSLTGTATSNLDSQTLQALLNLTQEDESEPLQQTDTSGQSGQAQGAHRRHHHHHGGSAGSSSASSGATASTGDSVAGTTGDSQASADASAPVLTKA